MDKGKFCFFYVINIYIYIASHLLRNYNHQVTDGPDWVPEGAGNYSERSATRSSQNLGGFLEWESNHGFGPNHTSVASPCPQFLVIPYMVCGRIGKPKEHTSNQTQATAVIRAYSYFSAPDLLHSQTVAQQPYTE